VHLAYTKVKARMRWSIKSGKNVESWGEGILLLDEWNYYEEEESPRSKHIAGCGGSHRWPRHPAFSITVWDNNYLPRIHCRRNFFSS
jgi:hypothetical protein